MHIVGSCRVVHSHIECSPTRLKPPCRWANDRREVSCMERQKFAMKRSIAWLSSDVGPSAAEGS